MTEMGYSFDHRDRLCCDRCGQSGNVRRRTCPHKVLGDSLRGARVALPWCPAPALCQACFVAHGGSRKIHAACKDSAARAQADYDKIEAALDAGESLSIAAWSGANVPDGFVGLAFKSRVESTYHLVPKAEYSNSTVVLSQVNAQPWPSHPGTQTKQVSAVALSLP